MKISVVGTGYVGLVSGVCLAEVGHEVTCVDLDPAKLKMLRAGKSPIFEPGLDQLLTQNIEHQRLFFTDSLKQSLEGAELVFIAVGTPPAEDGSADLKYVLGVAAEIAKHAEGPLLVAVKSTVPVGTGDLVEETIKRGLKERGLKNPPVLTVCSNPEFLAEGGAIKDFMHPDRVVVGLQGSDGRKIMEEVYRPFIIDDLSRLFFVDRRSSELIKYAANAMLATRVSFMNELSLLCDAVGANVEHLRLGMGADPRIGRKFLYAGPGFGGSCFPKDLSALRLTAQSYKIPMRILAAVEDANAAQKEYVASKILKSFGGTDLSGKRIAIWGLSFKPGTDDVRDSPSATIIRKLLEWGAEVCAHDPCASQSFLSSYPDLQKILLCHSAYQAVEGADALVLLTEWPEYKRPNFEKIGSLMRERRLFDFRNQYQTEVLSKHGFTYESVGRPSLDIKGPSAGQESR